MSRKYKFLNPDGIYFVTFAVVRWVDVFTRDIYREIILDSLKYCQKGKGLQLHHLYNKMTDKSFCLLQRLMPILQQKEQIERSENMRSRYIGNV